MRGYGSAKAGSAQLYAGGIGLRAVVGIRAVEAWLGLGIG